MNSVPETVAGPAAAAPSNLPRLRGGYRIVARKEFGDHVRSIRFGILAVLIALAGVAAIFASTTGIRDAASQASGAPNLFLFVFTIQGEGSPLPSFVQLLTLLGPLLGIAFGFDAVNGERAQGTLPRLLSQPIYRDDLINGKFLAGITAIATALFLLVAVVSGMAMLRLGLVPAWADVARVILWLVMSLVYIGFWLALASLMSVWLRRAATSALAAIAAWLVATLFAFLLVEIFAGILSPAGTQATIEDQIQNARTEQTLSRLMPGTLYNESTTALLNPQVRTTGLVFLSQASQLQSAIPEPLPLSQSMLIVLPQALGLIAMTVVTFVGAYVLFMRQEVRA